MAASVNSNRVSDVVTPEDLQALEGAKQAMGVAIISKLVSLGTQGLGSIPRVSESGDAFSALVVECALEHPELVSPFMNVEELQKDVNLVKVLRPFRRWVDELRDMLDETISLASGEAYMAALPFYTSAKSAAKLGLPAAVTVVAVLAPRFKRISNKARKAAAAAKPQGGTGEPTA